MPRGRNQVDGRTAAATDRRAIVDGNIFSSRGVHVAIARGSAIYGLKGMKLCELKEANTTTS
jgi:hypothetical protein